MTQLTSVRLCITCRHLDSEYESPGGGCDTCGHGAGQGFTLACRKEHFAEPSLYDKADFFSVLRRAIACIDYDELTPTEIEAM